MPTGNLRRDYGFRGNMLANMGAFRAHKYVYDDDPGRNMIAPQYRLEDDRVRILYLPGRAEATMRLKEVDN